LEDISLMIGGGSGGEMKLSTENKMKKGSIKSKRQRQHAAIEGIIMLKCRQMIRNERYIKR
jgi:hypothetical protein